jgi:hypothetical protein
MNEVPSGNASLIDGYWTARGDPTMKHGEDPRIGILEGLAGPVYIEEAQNRYRKFVNIGGIEAEIFLVFLCPAIE